MASAYEVVEEEGTDDLDDVRLEEGSSGDGGEDAAASPRAGSANGGSGERKVSRRDKVYGFSCVCVAAMIWVASSYWVQDLQSKGMTPLLMTSIANSCFTVILPVALWRSKKGLRSAREEAAEGEEEGEEKALMKKGGANSSFDPSDRAGEGSVEMSDLKAEKELKKNGGGGVRKAFILALTVWPLWFSALLTYNYSFEKTSVMTNTILSFGGTSIFTFLLEMLVMKSTFKKVKLAAVFLCIAGTVLWTYGQYTHSESHNSSLLGSALCIISSALYSVVSIRIASAAGASGSGSEGGGGGGEIDMSMFWGWMGVVNLSVMVPTNLVCWRLGLNDIQGLPLELWGMAVLKGLMDNLLSNLTWSYAVLYIGPTSANVGMSIQTPMVLLVDLCSGHASYLTTGAASALTGAAAIMVGFLLLNL